jgi:ribosomal protein S17E
MRRRLPLCFLMRRADRQQLAAFRHLRLSKQVLAFSEESLKTGFEHARKLAAIATIQELAAAQSKLVKSQIAGAERHIRELARTSRSKDPT